MYVVTSSLASPTGGGRTRVISAARQARKRGINITIMCFVRPDQIFPIRDLIIGKKNLARESGARVYYAPRLPGIRYSSIYRLNVIYCALIIAFVCWWKGINIIHAHGVSASFFTLMAMRIKPNLKLVADIHGSAVDEYLCAKKISEFDGMAKIIQRQEEEVLRAADWIIFVSERMREHFQRKYTTDFHRYTIIPCAVDTDFEYQLARREKLRQAYGLDDKLVFCYIGSGEDYQLPALMCWLFRRMLGIFPNAYFLILSHHRDVFIKNLQAQGVGEPYFRVEGVAHDRIFDLLQMGDIGFLLRNNSIVNQVSSPTKFAEYCLCGLPVITTDFVGDFSEIVKQYGLGFLMDTNTTTLDPRLIRFIQDVQSKREEYAMRCSQFAKAYLSWEKYGPSLVNIYTDLIHGSLNAPSIQGVRDLE